jgi:transposase InsO family protein
MGYHRKAVIRLLRRPAVRRARRRGRPVRYGPTVIGPLRQMWEAAGYPWSVRLRALLPAWLPWATRRWKIPAAVAQTLATMSPRQMDRALQPFKKEVRKRQYGRTKPGTLLKHQIPLRTDRWDVHVPGFTEIDLVAHSGDRADGDFLHSLNVTDIYTTWVETRAVMGKSQLHVQAALEHLRQQLPFRLQGIDSDNGSEFINHHLRGYCRAQRIQFTRGRPYKKDDNAHIEQKNWTHVRKLLGYVRYDSPAALTAVNALYDDLRLLQNLFLPSVKLIEKRRVGARLHRRYDAPQTPLERVEACSAIDRVRVRALQQLRRQLDPIALAQRIDQQLGQVYRLANQRLSPAAKIARVDAARPVDAQNASTRSLENRTERGFPQRPHASQPPVTSVTRKMARRYAAR